MGIFSLMPVSLCRAHQKQEVKSLSRSDIISRGNPFSQYHFQKNSSTSSSAFNVVFVGTNRISEPRQSVNVMMLSKPWSRGRGPMKSIATESQRRAGIGNGCDGPIGLVVDDLFC